MPSLTQIISYFKELNSSKEEAHSFFDYYESIGWRIGNSKMRNWQAACRNWIKRIPEFNRNKKAKMNCSKCNGTGQYYQKSERGTWGPFPCDCRIKK